MISKGLTLTEALDLDPVIRSGLFYIWAQQSGADVNVETGEVTWK